MPIGQDQVVNQRNQRGRGHLAVSEIDPDHQCHQGQEHRQRDQRPLGDLAAPRSADQAVGDLVRRDADLSCDRRADLRHLFGRVQRPGLHPDLVVADGVDGGFVEIGHAGVVQCVSHRVHGL